MRGLLYNILIQGKSYFIATIITSVVFTVTCGLLLNYCENTLVLQLLALTPILVPMTILCISLESVCKRTEKMLKCGYIKYTLTSGVSRNMYALTELVTILLIVAFSYGLSSGFFGVMKAIEPMMIGENYFRNCFLFFLLSGAITQTANVLTLYFKNEEKAGFVVGFICGFLVLVCGFVTEDEGGLRLEITDEIFWGGLIVSALIYAVCHVVMVLKLQRTSS